MHAGCLRIVFFVKNQVPEEPSNPINHTSFSVRVFTMVEKTVKVKLESRQG